MPERTIIAYLVLAVLVAGGIALVIWLSRNRRTHYRGTYINLHASNEGPHDLIDSSQHQEGDQAAQERSAP